MVSTQSFYVAIARGIRVGNAVPAVCDGRSSSACLSTADGNRIEVPDFDSEASLLLTGLLTRVQQFFGEVTVAALNLSALSRGVWPNALMPPSRSEAVKSAARQHNPLICDSRT